MVERRDPFNLHMPMIDRIHRNEDGTTLVVVVLSLVVLLGFAAIAIDGAASWALRRQDQSAADTGAIAGALFTAGKNKATAIADATGEVIRITYNTVDPDMTFAEWEAEWVACVDPGKPAVFTETGASDCISFTANLDKIRVQTPNIPWKTSFAQVMGFTEVDTSAFAEVDTDLAGGGGVLPFAMPSSAAGTGEICLKTGANPKNLAPCDGPDEGNFGFLDYTVFGDSEAGIAAVCNGGNSRLENNIANGIDHPLGEAPSPYAPPNEDRAACTDGNYNAQPYNIDTETGNIAQALDDGLVDTTGTGVPGRLRNSANTLNVRGHIVDNTPLWDYLNGAGQTYCGPIATHDAMTICLDSYRATGSTTVIFQDTLAESPRFGWVPLLYEGTLGNGTTTVTIDDFQPVYIQTTFWGCKASSCDVVWDPGEAVPPPGKNNILVEAATALEIPELALPEEMRGAAPGSQGQVRYLLSK